MKKILLGCGIVVLLFAIVVGIAVVSAPFLARKGIAMFQRLSNVESSWQPPSGKLESSWFPPKIGDWSRGEVSMLASVTDLDLTRDAMSASYQNESGRKVAVTIMAVSDAEKESLIKEAANTLQTKGGAQTTQTTQHLHKTVTITTNTSHFTSQVGNRTHVVVGDRHARLWLIKGWLFMFQSTGSGDPSDFAEAFVTSMPHAELPEAPEPEKNPRSDDTAP